MEDNTITSMNKVLIINADKQAYSPEQVYGTMTVNELIDQLRQYDGSMRVILSFDRGYTYGSLTDEKIHEKHINND